LASLCPKVLADSKKKDLLAGLNAGDYGYKSH
jgi:hypothetical protein